MKILFVTASQQELENIIKIKEYIDKTIDYEIITTGMGMVNTTYILTKQILKTKPDFVLNIGVCGSYNTKMPIGTVVSVKTENFGDFGIDDDGKFIPFKEFDEKLRLKKLVCKWAGIFNLPLANGTTVNTVTGSDILINKMKKNFNPDVESMEGAAVFYVCLLNKIPFAEIRAVSNMVEPRNKKKWNIELALTNLNLELPKIINKVQNNKI